MQQRAAIHQTHSPYVTILNTTSDEFMTRYEPKGVCVKDVHAHRVVGNAIQGKQPGFKTFFPIRAGNAAIPSKPKALEAMKNDKTMTLVECDGEFYLVGNHIHRTVFLKHLALAKPNPREDVALKSVRVIKYVRKHDNG